MWQIIFIPSQVGKSSEVGCLNSCCAVCIPDKNCDVCYKLNRSDPDNCPCINSLTSNQKESLLLFQKYFIEKFNSKSEEEKKEAVWKPYITSKTGNKIYYWLSSIFVWYCIVSEWQMSSWNSPEFKCNFIMWSDKCEIILKKCVFVTYGILHINFVLVDTIT